MLPREQALFSSLILSSLKANKKQYQSYNNQNDDGEPTGKMYFIQNSGSMMTYYCLERK